MEIPLQNDPSLLSPIHYKKVSEDTMRHDSNPKSGYHIRSVSDKKSFFMLKNQWNHLVERAEDSNPFMLWEWQYTWWDVYAEADNDLNILTIYKDDQLISIAPFYVKRMLKVIKRLSLLGEGEHSSDAVITHYPDIIVSKEHRKEVVLHIVEYLKEVTAKKGLFHFASFDLLKNNAVIHDVSEGLTAIIEVKKVQTGSQFVIPLPSNDEDYIASLSKSVRKQFRMKSNRLAKLGEMEITSEKNEAEGLKIVEKLVRARWESKMPTNMFDSKLFQAFHHKLAQNFSGQGVMDIRTMRLNGVPIVSAYNFNYQNKSYAYLSGFKSEDDRRLSPMFVFDLFELKSMINKKYISYDLLVSETDTNYKNKFGCDVSPCYRTVWLKQDFVGGVYKLVIRIKPYLSKWYHSFKGTPE